MLTKNISLANEDFKHDVLRGDAIIDCVSIKLTRNGAGAPLVYSAPGSIRFHPEKGVEARLVIPREEAEAYDPFAQIKAFQELASGQLVPDSHYYALEAEDVAGNVWTHPATSVDIDERLASRVVHVTCGYLRSESQVEKPAQLTAMVFMEKLPFPETRSNATKTRERGKNMVRIERGGSTGIAAGMEISYDLRSGGAGPDYSELFAQARPGVSLPENFDDRLLEAVRFSTAMVATPVMRETISGTARILEIARFDPSNKGIVDQPLYPRGFEADFYQLIDRYFAYACAAAKGKDYAPLSAKLGGTYTLKGVSLGTIALILAVAVESILGDEFFKRHGKPDKGELAKVQALFDHIKAASVEQSLITRALSALGTMKSTRAADKLNALVVAGSVTDEERKAWKDLRNPVAHGSFEVDPAELQKLVDAIYRISTLINKLVFLRIGYAGRFTNRSVHGKHGWPTWEFGSDGVALPPPPPPPAIAIDEPTPPAHSAPRAPASTPAPTPPPEPTQLVE